MESNLGVRLGPQRAPEVFALRVVLEEVQQHTVNASGAEGVQCSYGQATTQAAAPLVRVDGQTVEDSAPPVGTREDRPNESPLALGREGKSGVVLEESAP